MAVSNAPSMVTRKMELLISLKSRMPVHTVLPSNGNLDTLPLQSHNSRAVCDKSSAENRSLDSAFSDTGFSGSALNLEDKENSFFVHNCSIASDGGSVLQVGEKLNVYARNCDMYAAEVKSTVVEWCTNHLRTHYHCLYYVICLPSDDFLKWLQNVSPSKRTSSHLSSSFDET